MSRSSFSSGAFASCVLIAMALPAVALLQSCGAVTKTTGKTRVVATTSIIGDWVHEVGGDDVEAATLIGPDGDPHDYQPVPADSVKLADAEVICENGLGLESWLDKLCASARTTAIRVVVTQGIAVRYADDSSRIAVGAKEKDRDPHAWQSVQNAIVMINNIRDALIKADSVHAEGYRSRAAAYVVRLQSLDAYIQAQVESIPKAKRKLITSHDAFGYFGQRYGIEVSRNALESVTTEAADPSAKLIAQAIDQIKASGVPVIFLENIQNPKLMNRIAVEANVKVGPPLYSDALGRSGTPGDTYLKMMRYNTDVLVAALER